MQLAIADPERYVLKPQLEGGGEMNMVFLFFFFDSSSYKHKAQLMTTTSSVGRGLI